LFGMSANLWPARGPQWSARSTGGVMVTVALGPGTRLHSGFTPDPHASPALGSGTRPRASCHRRRGGGASPQRQPAGAGEAPRRGAWPGCWGGRGPAHARSPPAPIQAEIPPAPGHQPPGARQPAHEHEPALQARLLIALSYVVRHVQMYVVLHVYFYVEDDVHPGTTAPDEKTSLAPLLAVLHILLAPACGGSLIFQRSLVAGDRFGKDECATTYPFAHSSHSRAPGSRADPQNSAPHHSLRKERMCNVQARARLHPGQLALDLEGPTRAGTVVQAKRSALLWDMLTSVYEHLGLGRQARLAQ